MIVKDIFHNFRIFGEIIIFVILFNYLMIFILVNLGLYNSVRQIVYFKANRNSQVVVIIEIILLTRSALF